MGRLKGFTLLEMMVVVIIMGIIFMVALPSFTSMMKEYRTGAQVNDFISALAQARSEAVKRGVNVTVAAVGGDFLEGWQVTGGGDVFQEREALNGMALCSGCAGATNPSPSGFVFNQLGAVTVLGVTPSNAGGVIAFMPENCKTGTNSVRQVWVNRMGRVTTTRQPCP